jgi:hypothetical protein
VVQQEIFDGLIDLAVPYFFTANAYKENTMLEPFLLFEPEERVKGNDELKVAAEKVIDMIFTQLKTLKTKKSDW